VSEGSLGGTVASRVRRAAVVVAQSTGVLILLLLLGEGGARLLGVRPEPNPPLSFRWLETGDLFLVPPGSKISADRKKVITVNRSGLRGRKITAKRPGSFRILLLGDSVTFGYEVADGDVYPALVEQKLRTQGLDVEVINGSAPGWSRRQQRLFLEQFGPRVAPDLIVFTVVLNDLREVSATEANLRWSVRAATALAEAARFSALANAFKRALASAARPADEFHNVLDAYTRMTESADDPETRAALQLEYRETEALLADAPCPVIALLVPMSFQLEVDHTPVVQSVIGDFLRERHVTVLDLWPVLRPAGPFGAYIDHVHLNERGHALTADALVALLGDKGFLAKARRLAGRPATAR
jgi:lysophospholipase L1-like esterase